MTRQGYARVTGGTECRLGMVTIRSNSVLSKEDTVIVGDFNLCFVDQRNHQIFRTLESLGFNQLVKKPTHIKGRMIDLVFSKVSFEIIQQSPFFTDHDILLVKMEE